MEDEYISELTQAASYFDAGNFPEALKLYMKLAEQGDITAINFLAWMFYSGTGVVKNVESAAYWYKKSTFLDDPYGWFMLGDIREKESNVEEALRCYNNASDLWFSPAMYRLGCFYARGKFVKKDILKAKHYFKEATNQGHFFAAREYHVLNIKHGKISEKIPSIFAFLYNVIEGSIVAIKTEGKDFRFLV